MIIITFGTRRLTLLEPVVRGMPPMKDIMAASYDGPLGPNAYYATLP